MRLHNPDSNHIATSNVEDATVVNETNSEMDISPNHTTGIFTLDAGRQTPDAKQITIYNAYGERIYSASVIGHPSSVIDLSSHPAGIYFIKVISEGTIYTEKVVVQ